MPVKVEQIDASLFSDAEKRSKKVKVERDESIARSCSTGDIRPYGQRSLNKEEKTDETGRL